MSAFLATRDGSVLRVAFGSPATGEVIVRDAYAALNELELRGDLAGGGLLFINGRCTVPTAVMLGHSLSHLFTAIAAFDPKLDRYIVCVSHDPNYEVGQVISPIDI